MTNLTPADHVFVIFGGNGDLSRRKLLPSLYHLRAARLLPEDFRVIGTSRSKVSDDDFRALARAAVDEFGRCKVDEADWDDFVQRLTYVSCGFAQGETAPLVEAVDQATADLGGKPERLFYLSVPPNTFGRITDGLGDSGLVARGHSRVVYEKPFGLDEASFRELDETVRRVLDEDQVYRIDHFLAKETLQNVVAMRFANGMFEPVWNRQHIDHVQIDVPEELSIGSRAGFYEDTGALRDMVVTHLFQVLSVIAMEPPSSLESRPLIDEKVKVFESMLPLAPADLVRGQYEGYRATDGVAPDSDTETFVALRVFVDNWRWAGVPFYLRTGKCMAASRQTVTLAFRDPPRRMFSEFAFSDGETEREWRDHLTLDLGSTEGISLSFLAKVPGPSVTLGPARMTFSYEQSITSPSIGPYEKLIHDALLGDRTLFTRADGIGRTWELVRDVLDDPPLLHRYSQGTWGPAQAQDLIAPRHWHLPE